MIVYVIVTVAAVLFGLSLVTVYYRRQRTHPAVYQVSMARHLWQPKRRK
jgi:hypothetical protein